MTDLMNDGDTVFLSQDWFNESDSTATVAIGNNVSNTVADSGWYTNYTPTYWWPYRQEVKITLLLSEVEHLRKRCRDDKKLKKIMRKIAPHIKVEVDFP